MFALQIQSLHLRVIKHPLSQKQVNCMVKYIDSAWFMFYLTNEIRVLHDFNWTVYIIILLSPCLYLFFLYNRSKIDCDVHILQVL